MLFSKLLRWNVSVSIEIITYNVIFLFVIIHVLIKLG